MSIKVIFLLVFFPWLVCSGFQNSGRGARPNALANAFVAVGNSPWSSEYNPAGLVTCPEAELAVFMNPQQFGLKELRTISVAGVVPLHLASLGIVAGQFGFDLYRETTCTLAIGKAVDDGIAVGGAINVIRISVERYGVVTASSCDAGALVDVAEGLRIGFEWKNVSGSKIGASGEALPQVQDVGICYTFGESSLLAVGLEKDIRFPFELKVGYEQELLHALTMRFGMSSNPEKISVGLGVHFGGIEFSYAGLSHPQLGWTHQVEISCTAGR
ncbi:MAG: hypothetical protein NTU47_18700 [Ignavibacteriales bacterium]|nr:hypothetical protein [Ignavibacteriales bacterium]